MLRYWQYVLRKEPFTSCYSTGDFSFCRCCSL